MGISTNDQGKKAPCMIGNNRCVFAIEQDVNLCVSLNFAVSITIGRCIGQIYEMFKRIYSRSELERLQKKANQNKNKKQRHFTNWQYFQKFP